MDYEDPNYAYDPEGMMVEQARLSEALRQKQQQAILNQQRAFGPAPRKMVGAGKYAHYENDPWAAATNLVGTVGTAYQADKAGKDLQGEMANQAKARQREFDKWKLGQPAPAQVPQASQLPLASAAQGGVDAGPKSLGAGFQRVGYNPDETTPPESDTPGFYEGMAVSDAIGDDEDDTDDYEDPEADDAEPDDSDALDAPDILDDEPAPEDESAPPTESAEADTPESTSLAQNIIPASSGFQRTAAVQSATPSAPPSGVPSTQRPGDREMWLLEGIQHFPQLRHALATAYAKEAAARIAGTKQRAPINLGNGVLWDPNTNRPIAVQEYQQRTERKSELKREEQNLKALDARELELYRQEGKASTMEARKGFEDLRAKLARERIVSQEKVARMRADAKLGAANMIAKGMISGKQLPADVRKGVMESRLNMRTADRALETLTQNPDSIGWKGFVPQELLNRGDPRGTEARAWIGDLSSMIVHDRSGAAVTAAEFPRLKPFIPSLTDDYDTAVKKLRRFVEVYKQNEEMYSSVATEIFGGGTPTQPRSKGPPGSSGQPTYKYDANGNRLK